MHRTLKYAMIGVVSFKFSHHPPKEATPNMTKEINSLLRKKTWTGDAVGKAIIYSLIDAHRQTLKGVAIPAPIFSADKLRMMIGSLMDPSQLRRYQSYVGLQNWLIQYQAVATAYEKQAMGEISYFMGVLRTAIAVEEDHRLHESLPMIMTEKQHAELRQQGIEAQLTDAKGGSRSLTLFQAIGFVIPWILQGKGSRETTESLKALYEEQPLQSKRAAPEAQANGLGTPAKWAFLLEDGVKWAYPAIRTKALEDGKQPASAEIAEQAQDFLAEFPELAAACLAELDNALCGGMPALSTKKASAWHEPACTAEDMYERNLFGFRDVADKERFAFAGYPQATLRGVAVLQEANARDVDERGYFISPLHYSPVSIRCGIEQYTDQNSAKEQAVERALSARLELERSFYYLQGYDRAIELIAEAIDIPEFSIFQLGAEAAWAAVERYNQAIATLREKIEDEEFGEPARKADKLAVLAEYFPLLKRAELTIPEEAVREASAMLRDNLRAFDKQDSAFISVLTTRREGGEDG